MRHFSVYRSERRLSPAVKLALERVAVCLVVAAVLIFSMDKDGQRKSVLRLCTLVGFGQASAELTRRFFHLPGLIGALSFGLMYRFIFIPPPSSLCTPFRTLALAVLLLRAGLNIDIPTLVTNKAVTAALSVLPFIAESAVVAALSAKLISVSTVRGH